ncbi:hypothetical protein [Microbacterium sp. A93]|uniref:hypothetical protein n=1 Tax=Microbacterium sp. A93 TaxID=3450716 RepID=UPI003F42DBFB
MFVSPDVIGMIIALFAFTVTVLGGVAVMLARLTRILDVRFDRIDTRFDRIDARLDRHESELVDVKIAVARLEGPQRRLQQL